MPERTLNDWPAPSSGAAGGSKGGHRSPGLRAYVFRPRAKGPPLSRRQFLNLKLPPSHRDAGRPGAAAALVDGLGERCVIGFGAGAVGGPLFSSLAKLGVGKIVWVDPDRNGPRSHETQAAAPEDSGKLKALVQGKRAFASALPHVEVISIAGFAQDLPLSLLRQADLFVVAGDNHALRVWAGCIAQCFGKRLVDCAVHGNLWCLFLRVYELDRTDTACPGCGLSEKEWQSLPVRHGCDPETQRVSSPTRAVGEQATRTLPQFSLTAADIAATECLKCLLGLDAEVLLSEELSYCLLTHKQLRSELHRTKTCRCPHEKWETVDFPKRPEETSLAGVASHLGVERAQIQVRGERPWISEALCDACQRRVAVRRFIRRYGEMVAKCRCGKPLLALPRFGHSVLPATDLEASWEEPLSELGLEPSGEALGFSSGEGWTYCFFPGAPRLPRARRTGQITTKRRTV